MAHLRRCRARTLAAAYLEYASLGPARAALHLDPFEQPVRERFFNFMLESAKRRRLTTRSYHGG